MGGIDRRMFLQTTAGLVGAVALGACSKSTPQAPVALRLTDNPARGAGELPPTARVVLRAAGEDAGLPSPFGYAFPPGYFTMMYIYDSLLWTDSTGRLVPWLASDFKRSADGLTFTFVLRDNLRWHDGKLLTPDDVVFTFEYFAAQRATLPPVLLFKPEHVANVRATGPTTVEFRLDKPAATFPEQVAGRVPIIPRHIWSTIKDPSAVQDLKLLVGSGPYRLDNYAAGAGAYLFVANDDFFLGRPYFKRLEFFPVGDDLAALRADKIDVTEVSTGAFAGELAPFTQDQKFAIISGPPNLLFALYWNLGRGGALGDVRFRQACAHAINRADMVERILGGNGEVGNPGFLPEGHPFRVPVEQYPFDPARAEEMLDAAGYRRSGGSKSTRQAPDGSPLRFDLLADPVTADAASAVSNQLAAVGVRLDVQPSDFIFPKLAKGEFQTALLLFGGQAGDPDLMRLVYSSRVDKGFEAVRGYVNAELDDLADQQLVTLDETERKRLVGRMQEIVASDLPALHLYYPTDFLIYRKAAFDQWSLGRAHLGPFNKQVLLTGVAGGGVAIRPVTD